MRMAVGLSIFVVTALLAGLGEVMAQAAAGPPVGTAAYRQDRTITSGPEEAGKPSSRQKRGKDSRSREEGRSRGAAGRQRGQGYCGYIRQAVGAATAAGLDNGAGLIARARAYCGG